MRVTGPGRAALCGMSLIELMIGLTIAAILLLLAAPAYRDFIAKTNVRNAAENTLAGLRLANAEAVKRNAPVQFSLVEGGWSVDEVDPADGAVVNAIQSYKFSEGAAKAVIDSLGAGAAITFNGLGRILPTNYDASKLITEAPARNIMRIPMATPIRNRSLSASLRVYCSTVSPLSSSSTRLSSDGVSISTTPNPA